MYSLRSPAVAVAVPFLLAMGCVAANAAAQSRPTLAPAAGAGPQVVVPAAVAERAKTYDFKPANIASAAMREEVAQANGPSLIARKINTKPAQAKPKLNVTKMGQDMHAALKDNVRGYAFQVRKGGQPIYTLIWDWARAPGQGSSGWSLSTRMHVASVSKLITAIAAVKMLDERNLSFDTKIGPYLPTYWTVGPNSADITFRDLLTHRAGFTDTYYDGNYPTFKAQIQNGVVASPPGNYTNGAFSLVRVLNATMTNEVPRTYVFPLNVAQSQKDAVWDQLSSMAFERYVANKVFAPSGVSGVASTPTPGSAFAYSTRPDTAGWDSGELQTQLGGAGFRVSVNDMLDVMGTFRRKGTIVPAAKAQQAMDASLGIDSITDSPAGKMYLKNGWWGGGGKDGQSWHVEQAVAAFLPDDMEAVVLCNSNIGPQGASLTQTFRNAVLNNIE